MSSREPVSLSRITKAIEDTIRDLRKFGDLSPRDEEERQRVIDLLEHLAGILTVAAPCYGSFIPSWVKPR